MLDHYLRVELCPCSGAPAADAKPRVASSPPAETLTADRHGAFVSGYAHALVFFNVFQVLEMQCFVLSYLLSPKPARWTLRPASRKHGLCPIAGAQTHPRELCTTSAPAQPNGRAFFGNRSRHWIVRLFICKKRLFQPLLALRAEPGGAPITGRQIFAG